MTRLEVLIGWCRLAQIELSVGQPAKAEYLMRQGLIESRRLAVT